MCFRTKIKNEQFLFSAEQNKYFFFDGNQKMFFLGQLLIIRQILEKKLEKNEAVHQLFIDFKKACNSVRMKALYNIHIEYGIPLKLVRQILICLNETYS